jgi:uncharacterized protein (TIGR03435 family)
MRLHTLGVIPAWLASIWLLRKVLSEIASRPLRRMILREDDGMVGKILAVGLLSTGMAFGQTVVAPSAPVALMAPTTAVSTSAPTKAYRFDEVSIRQNKSAPQNFAGMRPDGYRRTYIEMWVPLMTAYLPQVGGMGYYLHDQIRGLPDWAKSEKYDIDARISDKDRAAWQKPEMQQVMLQSMLQAMYVECCKLAVHREVNELPVYSMMVVKGGPKFKKTDPTVDLPKGQKMDWGGVLVLGEDGVHLYGTPMTSLASFLSAFLSMSGGVGRPIQDKTGLTGRYDVTLKFPNSDCSPPDQAEEAAEDLGNVANSALNGLGLKLVPDKGPVETLVIDHMERPSAN